MKRVLKLQVKTAKIEMMDGLGVPLDYWVPSQEHALTFELREEAFNGLISLYLDPEGVELEWDTHDWQTVLEYPVSCTQIAVVIAAESEEDVTDRQFLAMAQRQTHTYVNGILSYVRVELGQYWVRSLPLSAMYLVSFLEETKAMWLDEDRQKPVLEGVDSWEETHALATDYYELQHSHEWYAPFGPLTQDEWNQIHSRVLQQQHSTEQELMGNAKHHFSTLEFRTAAVEAVAALELGLSSFVRERSKAKGVSHKKFGDVHRNFGVSAYLNVLLPLVLATGELDAWLNAQRWEGRHLHPPFRRLKDDLDGDAMLSHCLKLSALRNKIVHEGRIPDESDVDKIEDGIEAAEWLLTFTDDQS